MSDVVIVEHDMKLADCPRPDCRAGAKLIEIAPTKRIKSYYIHCTACFICTDETDDVRTLVSEWNRSETKRERIIDLDEQIMELGLIDTDPHAAEAIFYAWALQTKLYLMGEGNLSLTADEKDLLGRTIDGCEEYIGEEHPTQADALIEDLCEEIAYETRLAADPGEEWKRLCGRLLERLEETENKLEVELSKND